LPLSQKNKGSPRLPDGSFVPTAQQKEISVIDLSATLVGFASFVLVVLTICGISYYKADSLQTWAENTLRPKRNHRR
jgi:hypothetical protein